MTVDVKYAFDFFAGGTHGQEGVHQKAEEAEPTCQHQQQGEEEDQELHDDEAQSERQNERQTLLQRETGKSQPSEGTAASSLNRFLFHLKLK